MEEFDKEFFILRKKLQTLQNFERISFFNWLFHYRRFELFGFNIILPINLLCLIFITLFISKPLAEEFIGQSDLTTTLAISVLICYAVYYRFSRMIKSEKEHNFLKLIISFTLKILKRILG